MTLRELFETVEQLPDDEKQLLLEFLRKQLDSSEKVVLQNRILSLHRGAFSISEDFNDELPDSFWLGEE